MIEAKYWSEHKKMLSELETISVAIKGLENDLITRLGGMITELNIE